ncbi:MAG: hypothetical protein WA790_01970 [Sulfitobacter sp.]
MFKPLLSVCIAALSLAGCSSISPAGLLAAAQLDPIQTPPDNISIAISVPEVVRLRDGDAELYLGFMTDDKNMSAPVEATVPLAILNEAGPRPAETGEAIYVFGFSTSSAAELSAIQEKIKAQKANDVAGTGTLKVAIEGGCITGALNGKLPVATWLRTSPTGKFVSLTRKSDFLDALPRTERDQLLANLKPC